MQSPPKPNKNERKYMFLLVIAHAFVISRRDEKTFFVLFSSGSAEITPIIVENKTTKEQTERIDFDA